MYRMIRANRTAHLLLLACLVLYPGAAYACQVCVPFPEKTATDRLIRADTVVLAREDAGRPFYYAAIEILKGELPETAINLFVDSATRRLLGHSADHRVVLAFDRSTRHWQSIGYATPAYRKLVEAILARAPSWQGQQGAQDRARFFLPYLAQQDRDVRMLAYLEVGQSSYDIIRIADNYVPTRQVQRFLNDTRYLEWRRLYILLLGIDASAAEKTAIRARMKTIAELNQTTNLSAWATALIEIDAENAIDWLETAYIENTERDREAVIEVIKALSVHGAGPYSRLRQRIIKSYTVLIQTHPSLAGWAARDLAAWNDWRFADRFIELRSSNQAIDSASAYAIDYYIGRASRTQ